jgi:signal transduction histidine kinase
MPLTSSKKSSINLALTIILPAILSVVLFFLTIFFLVLPSMESALMTHKRDLTSEMTELAWNTLDQFHRKTLTGELTEAAAKAAAVDFLRNFRYGDELKDYFWINDMHPIIIMHPYRIDLEGTDVTDFTDPNGKRLFVDFVETVRGRGEGFVDYEWQWMDDSDRIAPKISFVKAFEPWGWVVGTGIYTDDVANEIAAITKQLTFTTVGILIFIAVLSAIIIIKSISVEKRKRAAEAKARLQQEQLFQAGKMATIGTLAAGVAHEINNPTMAISLNIGILKETWKNLAFIVEDFCLQNKDFKVKEMDFDELNQRIPQMLNHIEDNAGRIQNIVSELKDFSRISSSKLKNDVNINLAVEKAVALVGNTIRHSTDFFSTSLAPDPPTFKGNMQKVEQVIVNLLVNASQALEEKNQRIEVTTGFDHSRHRVTVEVADTGSGMSEETLVRIRDPFYTTRQNSGNTGLGLAISQRIMEDHGGDMVFASSPGKGTRATISFPVATDKGA